MSTEVSKATGYDTVLDVDAERLAKVYAKAFLAAATGKARGGGMSEAEAVTELKAVVAEVLDPFPRFGDAIQSAFLSHDERAALIDKVLKGKVDDVVLNTLKVMSAHDRLGLLRSVARQAEEIYDADSGRAHISVTSAHGLTPELVSQLENALRAKFGIEPVLKQVVDPDMIAGVKIRVGDTVYDGSLKTIFAKARSAIVTRAIERIENNPDHFLSEGSAS